MFRSSPLQVVNFRSGGKSDIKKKRGKEENVFKEYLFNFLFFSFLFFSFFYGQAVELAERYFRLLTRGRTLLLYWLSYLRASLGLFCPH